MVAVHSRDVTKWRSDASPNVNFRIVISDTNYAGVAHFTSTSKSGHCSKSGHTFLAPCNRIIVHSRFNDRFDFPIGALFFECVFVVILCCVQFEISLRIFPKARLFSLCSKFNCPSILARIFPRNYLI